MAVIELDPVFLKALKLLHSTSKDAAEQLKQMYYDAVGKKKVDWDGRKVDEDDFRHGRKDKHKKESAEKRSFEKIKQELDSLQGDAVVCKKPKLDIEPSKDSKDRSKEKKKEKEKEKEKSKPIHYDSDSDPEDWIKEKERELAKREAEEERDESKERDKVRDESKEHLILDSESSDDEQDKSTDNVALDLMDFTCVLCGEFGVGTGNQLVECQDCHNLYHQECHKPTVSEKEIGDPRFVWYCSKCTKERAKKLAAKSSKSSKLSSQSSSSSTSLKESHKESQSKSSKPGDVIAPFKRMESSKSSSSKESSSVSSKQAPFAALSSLAANLANKESNKPKSTDVIKAKSDAGSFLFADPIRLGTSKSSSSSKDKALGLSAMAKAEAVARSTNKPIDNVKFSSLGKKTSSSSGSKSSSSSSSSHTYSSASASSKSSNSNPQRQSSSSSSSSKTGSSSDKTHSSGHAEKRLQLMKKKAATKQISQRNPFK